MHVLEKQNASESVQLKFLLITFLGLESNHPLRESFFLQANLQLGLLMKSLYTTLVTLLLNYHCLCSQLSL